jgi:hypothetical protein
MPTLHSIPVTSSGLQLVNLAPGSQLLAVDSTEAYTVIYVLTDLTQPATDQYELLVATMNDSVDSEYTFLGNSADTLVFYHKL